MILVYRPKGGEERRFLIHPDGFTLAEIDEIESITGMGLMDFVNRLTIGGRIGALRPVLYIYLKRENPTLKYKDVNPYINEIQIAMSKDDYIAEREKVEADPNHPNRDLVLTYLDEQIAAGEDIEGPGKGSAPSRRRSTSLARPSRKRGRAAD